MKPRWAVAKLIRGDRRDKYIEDICKHGVGHPNREWLKKQKDAYASIHGCDGCCAQVDQIDQPEKEKDAETN